MAGTNSKGVEIQIGDGAGPEVFTAIGKVTDLQTPSEQLATIDVTSFESDAKEFIADIPDGGEVSATVVFVAGDAGQAQLRDDYEAGTLRNFKILLNDDDTTPTTYAFAALITKPPQVKVTVGSAITAEFTLKVSGVVSVTFAS